MTDIITLSSSDDEDTGPVTKRIKKFVDPIPIVLSDEEEVGEKPAANGIVSQVDDNTNEIRIKSKTVLRSRLVEGASSSNTESEGDSIKIKFSSFIDQIFQSIPSNEDRDKLANTLPKMKGHFEQLCNLNVDLKDLGCMLDSDKHRTYDSYKAIVRYGEIFDFLNSKLKSAENDRIFSGSKRHLLNKLEKTLLIVRKRIQILDEAEVDFDEEENSNYIKAARYKDRADKIFRKICEIRKEDPNEGRLAYSKLKFTDSKYPIINKVINKKYKNIIEFPTYYELDKCIRRYVEAKDLRITEDELKSEIRFCFEKLGNIMQRKRKFDLYNTHMDYIQNEEDPATKDEEMAKRLQDNLSMGNTKMQEVYEKYTRMQDSGVNPDVSSDTDDSHEDDSN